MRPISNKNLSRLSLLVKYTLPFFSFFLALVFCRIQICKSLELSVSTSIKNNINLGFFNDFIFAFLPLVISNLLAGFFKVSKKITWSLTATALWLLSISNSLHVEFYGTALNWITMRSQWHDPILIYSSILALANKTLLILSFLLLILSIALKYSQPKNECLSFSSRINIISAFIVLIVAIYFQQLPFHHKVFTEQLLDVTLDDIGKPYGLLSQQVTAVIIKDIFHGVKIKYAVDERGNPVKNPATLLAQFKDYPNKPQPTNRDWPLYRNAIPDENITRNLKIELGFKSEQKINVIIIFVESFRALELGNKEIADAILPNLQKIFKNNSILFSQSYSSSLTDGQTVRAHFSVLCSMLPDILGPATYIANSSVSVRCIQNLFRANGYETYWFAPHQKDFNNKAFFELRNGIDHIYDIDYFKQKGIQDTFELGIADKPFFNETFQTLLKKSQNGKPFFAHMINVGTHHPWSKPNGIEIPAELKKKLGDYEEYMAYLYRLKYMDQALGNFFDSFFKSSLSKNTVVVLTGDHSITLRPYFNLNEIQNEEMKFRIPIAIISKNMRKPRVVKRAVHQMDIAPFLADLTGLVGPITWMGKNILSENGGSPWVYEFPGERLFYRTANTACYTPRFHKMSCWDVTGKDPLIDVLTTKIPENENLSLFFRKVIEADYLSISNNKLAPKKDP